MTTREAAVELRSAQAPQQVPKHIVEKPRSETNLMSLTDEALYALFSHMCTTKKGHILRVPKRAFPLAMAHPRFLRVFASLMTHVTLDKGFLGPRFVLLTQSFFLEVIKAGGKALRKLRVQSLGCGLFKNLTELCPNLESLTFSGKCECDACGDTLSKILCTNIRSLKIKLPAAKTLSFITRAPPKLSLQLVILRSDDFQLYEELDRILRHPPKELHVWAVFLFCTSSAEERLTSILYDACPKIEKLTVAIPTIPCGNPSPLDISLEEATQCISSARENKVESSCRSISVSGRVTFSLLENSHPNASIEVSCGSVIVSDVGYGTYINNMILPEEYIELDVSRLQGLTIESGDCNLEWKDALQGLKLKNVDVSDVTRANELCLNVEVVTIDCNLIKGNEWEWLQNVQELHLTDPNSLDEVDKEFLKGLVHAIDNLGGYKILILDFYMFREVRIVTGEGFRHGLQALYAAIERFEGRGGNGEMLTDLVHHLQRCISD